MPYDKKALYKEEEIIAAEISLASETEIPETDLDARLAGINSELERYICTLDTVEYAFSIYSGILAGMIDSIFIGEISITDNDISLSHNQVNNFIQQYAKARGYDNDRLKDAIADLEGAFKVAQDNAWKRAEIKVSTKNHHLADLAHHPTPLGLVSALIVQFMKVGTFVNRDGEWHIIFLNTNIKDIVTDTVAPVLITGVLHWLCGIAETSYEEYYDKEMPKAMRGFLRIAASSPVLIEVTKCADNWFGHLVSDMGGSKNTAGEGMGIPGVFLSLLYEMAALPLLKDSGLPEYLNGLYQNNKLDLRHELCLYKAAGRQMIPVAFNEVYVRLLYFVRQLAIEAASQNGIRNMNWGKLVPFGNRDVDRMLTVASLTFTFADTADAAAHAAMESAGNWLLFGGKFVARYNYIGAGRAAFALVKEFSYERREAQLIHEKMILTTAKTEQMVARVEEYKTKLEEALAKYLAEDIESFMSGFECINSGIAADDSDAVIRGNVIIQRVLGREPQFVNQQEFDELMTSEEPLRL